ncbi:MAG: response regulator [Rhodothermales bacterium]
MATRIFLIDDHPIVREGMERMIAREADMEVCGESDGGDETLDKLIKASPQVVVLDLSLTHSSGFDLIHTIQQHLPKAAIIVLSMHDENLYAERTLRAGASGYIMKQEAPAKVLNAIRKVAAGHIYVSEAISKRLLKGLVKPSTDSPLASLSDREFQVFQYIGEGGSHQEIADRLNLSIKTIESHVERIKNKLGLKSGRELLRRAMEWVIRNQGPVGVE